MTDQMIPADKVRRILDEWERIKEHADWDDIDNLVQDVRALLPTPPTLADMTEEERAACLRMQCDTGPNRSVRGFIAEVHPGGCRVIERDTWKWLSCSDDMVTPRPDLPRMEWPGVEKPAPVPALPHGWRLADHPRHGRVIVTNTTPNRNGHVYFVHRAADHMGVDWHRCDPDELTYIAGEQEGNS